MYIYIYRNEKTKEWRWKTQTARPPKVGKITSNGGEGFKNFKHVCKICAKMFGVWEPGQVTKIDLNNYFIKK